MSDIRLIASDMDHTLLTDAGQLPPGFQSVVDRLADAGIAFVAASGRPYSTLTKMFPAGGPHMGYAGDNGSIVSFADHVLYESALPQQLSREMVAGALVNTPGIPVLSGEDRAFVASSDLQYKDYFETFYWKLEVVDDLLDVDEATVKFTTYFPEGNSKTYAQQYFVPKYSNAFEVTTSGMNWVDIMNPGVSKGAALQKIAEHLGVERSQMMAFGDANNDLPMLDAVDHSYAVANANETVRDRARFVTDSNDDFGVVKVIEQVLDGKL